MISLPTILCLCAASFLAGMLTIASVNRWGRSVAEHDIRQHEAERATGCDASKD
jgi:hypothetical protein